MYKKTITYTDFNDVERTEDFYFNISKAELFNLNFSYPGGLADHIRRINSAQDNVELIKVFSEIIDLAYGEKDATGRRFIKSPELTEAFKQTNAYSILYMELATDSDAAAEFINGVVPADLSEAATKAQLPG